MTILHQHCLAALSQKAFDSSLMLTHVELLLFTDQIHRQGNRWSDVIIKRNLAYIDFWKYSGISMRHLS